MRVWGVLFTAILFLSLEVGAKVPTIEPQTVTVGDRRFELAANGEVTMFSTKHALGVPLEGAPSMKKIFNIGRFVFAISDEGYEHDHVFLLSPPKEKNVFQSVLTTVMSSRLSHLILGDHKPRDLYRLTAFALNDEYEIRGREERVISLYVYKLGTEGADIHIHTRWSGENAEGPKWISMRQLIEEFEANTGSKDCSFPLLSKIY